MRRLLIAILLFPMFSFAQGNLSRSGNNRFGSNNTFSGTNATANLNNTVYADQQSGSDSCAKINTAIGLLPSTGGTVHAEGFQGAQTCASTLTITKPLTILFGANQTWTFNANPGIAVNSSDVILTGAGSTTEFIGGFSAGTILQVSAVSGASNQALQRDRATGIEFNCNNVDAIGLQILSERAGDFSHNTFQNCTTTALDLGVVATLGEARDTQFNLFGGLICHESRLASSGYCIRIGGDSGANASFNTFVGLDLDTYNGNCWEDLDGDSNTAYNVGCAVISGGSNVGIHFTGTSSSVFARSEVMYNVSSAGGAKQDANATSNHIYHYEKENGAPEPTVSAGTFTWTEDDRNGLGWHIPRLTTPSFPTSPTCSVTGAGTGATCALTSGSGDSWGSMSISTGTSPSSSGTITLTFTSNFGNAAAQCVMMLASGNAAWNARATIQGNNEGALANSVGAWDNNAVNLGASTGGAYVVNYFCGGR